MELEFWQAFLSGEIPIARSKEILKTLDSSRPISPQLANHPLLNASESQKISQCDIDCLSKLKDSNINVIEANDFPLPLQNAAGGPPAIFFKGDLAALSTPSVGIVGTRSATTYGRAVAKKFASRLAEVGVTIISGGAIGIDAASHEGALEVGGRSIAVMAGGLDMLYPAMHHNLFRRLEARGGLVSVYPFGSRAKSHRFLERNWIIAAMSLATLVIEAPTKSGALKTASDAIDLGRPVLVVPSGIENINFKGSHGLIRDGATLVDHPDQVLEAIDWRPPVVESQPVLFSPSGAKIILALETAPLRPEVLSERTGLSTSELLSELTLLEMEGKVIRGSGGYALVP